MIISVTFPLIPGHPVLEGHITLPLVAKNLIVYHPLLKYIVRAATFLKKNPAIGHLEAPIPFPPALSPPHFDPTKKLAPSLVFNPTNLFHDPKHTIYDPHTAVTSRVASYPFLFKHASTSTLNISYYTCTTLPTLQHNTMSLWPQHLFLIKTFQHTPR